MKGPSEGCQISVRKCVLVIVYVVVGNILCVYRVFHDLWTLLQEVISYVRICDQKSSYKHVSDFGLLRSYDRLKLRKEGNDY